MNSSLMTLPPQKNFWPEPPCRETSQGQVPGRTSSPPTILSALGYTAGRVPQTEDQTHIRYTRFSLGILKNATKNVVRKKVCSWKLDWTKLLQMLSKRYCSVAETRYLYQINHHRITIVCLFFSYHQTRLCTFFARQDIYTITLCYVTREDPG